MSGPAETDHADATRVDDPRVAEVLARWWGFERLRPLQAEALQAALAGRDWPCVESCGSDRHPIGRHLHAAGPSPVGSP